MTRNLLSRIERLESQRPAGGQTHVIVHAIGESEDDAWQRYTKTGREIRDGDTVVQVRFPEPKSM